MTRHRWLIPTILAALFAACDNKDPLAPSFALSGNGTPAAPTNLTASADSYHQIWLAWQDNATNEAGFEVWRSTTGSGGTFSLFTTYPWPNTTTGGNDGLQALTEYCYKVRAYSTLGQSGKVRAYSGFSNIACATTKSLPVPAAPSALNAKPDPWGILITWTDNASDETGFRVERSATSNGPWTSLGNISPNVVSFRDWQPPANEQTACYRVIAFNSYGDSPSSNVACTASPKPPSNLVATASGPAVDLTWTDNSVIEDGFHVYRWTVANGVPVVIATLSANATAYHDAGLADDIYYYQVRATKNGGESDGSNNAAASVVTAPPAAPSALAVYPSSSSSMTITWVDNSTSEAGFRVERSADGGASWSAVETAPQDATSLGDAGLSSEQRACYRVIAFNSLGDSQVSNTGCATPPAAPTGLVAIGAAVGAIDLTWTDNSGVEDGYAVLRLTLGQYCDDGGCYDYYYYDQIATLDANATSYRDSGLFSGDSHSYVVVALKDGGHSDQSNEATATVP